MRHHSTAHANFGGAPAGSSFLPAESMPGNFLWRHSRSCAGRLVLSRGVRWIRGDPCLRSGKRAGQQGDKFYWRSVHIQDLGAHTALSLASEEEESSACTREKCFGFRLRSGIRGRCYESSCGSFHSSWSEDTVVCVADGSVASRAGNKICWMAVAQVRILRECADALSCHLL